MPASPPRQNRASPFVLSIVVVAIIALHSIAVAGFQLRPNFSASRRFVFRISSRIQHDEGENIQNVDSGQQKRLAASNEYFVTDALFVREYDLLV